jgi:hypothetical protein
MGDWPGLGSGVVGDGVSGVECVVWCFRASRSLGTVRKRLLIQPGLSENERDACLPTYESWWYLHDNSES